MPTPNPPMPDQAPLGATPGLPLHGETPVFGEPWQAQAFALTVSLHRKGLFDWSEWVAYLSREIAANPAHEGEDPGHAYYECWLAALEKIALDKGLAEAGPLAARRAHVAATVPDRHGHVARREPLRVA